MQPDLEDALIPVKWAKQQIGVFRQRFIEWQRTHPYELVMEADPTDPDWEFLTAYLRKPLDPLLIGDAGAIINSARTGLDILMARLLARHAVTVTRTPYFPIRETEAHFLADIQGLESKGWLDGVEAAELRRTRAFNGGNSFLWPLHNLDNTRKHNRVLVLEPDIEATQITLINGYSYVDHRQLPDRTITHRIPTRAHFRPFPGNTLVAGQVFLNESALTSKRPAHIVLDWFAATAQTIIENFP